MDEIFYFEVFHSIMRFTTILQAASVFFIENNRIKQGNGVVALRSTLNIEKENFSKYIQKQYLNIEKYLGSSASMFNISFGKIFNNFSLQETPEFAIMLMYDKSKKETRARMIEFETLTDTSITVVQAIYFWDDNYDADWNYIIVFGQYGKVISEFGLHENNIDEIDYEAAIGKYISSIYSSGGSLPDEAAYSLLLIGNGQTSCPELDEIRKLKAKDEKEHLEQLIEQMKKIKKEKSENKQEKSQTPNDIQNTEKQLEL